MSSKQDMAEFGDYNGETQRRPRLRLTRRTFNFEDFVDTSFLTQALTELNLENCWQPRRVDGSPTG